MKNALLLLIITLPFASLSQTKGEFVLTPTGLVDKADETKQFIVQDYPGETKEQLYKKTLLYFTKQFTSPKDVISKVENESITINAIDDRIPVKGYSGSFDLNYTLTVEFKDNKLRIIAPSVNSITGYPNGNLIKIGVIGNPYNKTIFSEKGELKLEKTKQTIELIFKSWLVKIAIGIKDAKTDNW